MLYCNNLIGDEFCILKYCFLLSIKNNTFNDIARCDMFNKCVKSYAMKEIKLVEHSVAG